jgi:hypothetical protein
MGFSLASFCGEDSVRVYQIIKRDPAKAFYEAGILKKSVSPGGGV